MQKFVSIKQENLQCKWYTAQILVVGWNIVPELSIPITVIHIDEYSTVSAGFPVLNLINVYQTRRNM